MTAAPDPAPSSGDFDDSAHIAPDSRLPPLRSEDLLQGRREILIAHCEEVYRLRLTRNGKLILTK